VSQRKSRRRDVATLVADAKRREFRYSGSDGLLVFNGNTEAWLTAVRRQRRIREAVDRSLRAAGIRVVTRDNATRAELEQDRIDALEELSFLGWGRP
jgi:hypothetical protein